MRTESLSLIDIAISNSSIFYIACFGGLVLFALKATEHFNRPIENKHSPGRYAIYVLFLFLTLPVLGGAVVVIYLANGDKISPVLAFQVGLTSPAIVQSLIIAAANNMSKQSMPTTPNQ